MRGLITQLSLSGKAAGPRQDSALASVERHTLSISLKSNYINFQTKTREHIFKLAMKIYTLVLKLGMACFDDITN